MRLSLEEPIVGTQAVAAPSAAILRLEAGRSCGSWGDEGRKIGVS